MRQSRIKVVGEAAVYHCISRVVAGERLLDDLAKEGLRKMLWKTAAFCGVEVLAYCVMSNHFHVLVRVTPVDLEEPLSKAELLRRYRVFYGEVPSSPNFPSAEVLAAKFDEGGEEAERWERRLRMRMGDVSEFMKTLKQRFTIWYNKLHRRFGTLWSERFKSVLVEDSAFALKTVAAYIDLNPVRASLVSDPAEYRWCSYGEAMGGSVVARDGLGLVVQEGDWSDAGDAYRMILFGKGSTVRRVGQSAIPMEAAKEVLARQGKLPVTEALRFRIRHFTDGAILGSRSYVTSVARKLYEPEQAAMKSGERCGTHFVANASRAKNKRLGEIQLAGEDRLMSWRNLRGGSISAPTNAGSEIDAG